MQPLTKYLKVLNQLASQVGFQVEVQAKGDTLVVNGIAFTKARRQDLSNGAAANEGFLFPSLTEDERQFCMKHRINYLTLDGQLQVSLEQTTLSITQGKKVRKKAAPLKAKTTEWVSPTLLISPYALSILDILFRVPAQEVIQASSVLSFSKKFDLYQPKLSKLMRELGAKNLVSLKEKITALPEEWWLLALQYPGTKKRLTPFFDVAKPFHSLETKPTSDEELNSAILKMKSNLIPGPVEIAKKFGLINDTDHYLWGTTEVLQEFKNQYRLVPGKSSSGPTWYVATPTRELHQEAIASHSKLFSPHPMDLANPFRAVWDLSFGSERLKEVRMTLLRSLLK